jgi:hypothetical protein
MRTTIRGNCLAVAALVLTASASGAQADEVITENLIVQGGSLCTGPECVDGEYFAFDTIRIKGPDPVLNFQDSSTSGGFASADWNVGVTDDGMGGPSSLFIDHSTSGTRMLHLDVDGAVALGAGAEVVSGAVSVGAMGSERQILHVADAVDETDAVNLRQFEAFQDDVNDSLGADADAFDQRLDDLQTRISSLTTRVDELAARIEEQ